MQPQVHNASEIGEHDLVESFVAVLGGLPKAQRGRIAEALKGPPTPLPTPKQKEIVENDAERQRACDGLRAALRSRKGSSEYAVRSELRRLQPLAKDAEEETLVCEAEQLLADIDAADKALVAAMPPEGDDREALELAIELAEAVGEFSRLGDRLPAARKQLDRLESRDAAHEALLKLLGELYTSPPTDASKVQASRERLETLTAEARKQGIVDERLYKNVARQCRTLEMIGSSREVDYSDIKWGKRLNRGGGSGAEIFGVEHNGWKGAAKVWKVSQDEKARRKIVKELAALKMAQSPYVVGLLGIAFELKEGEAVRTVLLMERVSDCSLHDLVHKEPDDRPLPCTAISSIALGIARGMLHLHGLIDAAGKSLVHHDLKSANVSSTFDPDHFSEASSSLPPSPNALSPCPR